MDVRCERCKTEYELDDASISSAGTEVQCSDCGHTFVVKRTAPPTAAPEWQVQTEAGQAYRFRAVADLQKLIIERKLTRLDRISQDGQAWRRLGELGDLHAFFDVVEQADRASSQEMLTVPEPELRHNSSRRIPQEDPRSSVAAMAVDTRGSTPTEAASGQETTVVRLRSQAHGAAKIFIGLSVAAAVAFVGIRWQHGRLRTAAIASDTSDDLSSDVRAAPSHPAMRQEPAVVPMAAVAEPTLARPAAAPSRPVVEPLEEPAPPAAAKPSGGGKVKTAVAGAPSGSYDHMVAEGDRLLERGASGKARHLYEQALKQRPNGAEALTGLGYVALDRRQAANALALFKRALVARASFGPALFGLAEVYRATGDKTFALQSYRRYVQVAPNGPEAGAARRQIQRLEGER